MLNHITGTVSANRKSFELGNGSKMGIVAALVGMVHRPSITVCHSHPGFIQDAAPCISTVQIEPRANRALELRRGEQELVCGSVPGSWLTGWSSVGRGPKQLVARRVDVASSDWLLLIPAAGTPRLAPSFARGWVFTS